MKAYDLEPTPEFCEQLDKTILENSNDKGFMQKIKDLDILARKEDTTLYRLLYRYMYQDKAAKQAAQWFADRVKE